jgi:hypothetical protein
MEERIALGDHSWYQQPKKFPAMNQEENRLSLELPDSVPHAQDYWRINLREEWEIRFWTREFGCSDGALREAVTAVGDCAGDVRAHLLAQHQQRRT